MHYLKLLSLFVEETRRMTAKAKAVSIHATIPVEGRKVAGWKGGQWRMSGRGNSVWFYAVTLLNFEVCCD